MAPIPVTLILAGSKDAIKKVTLQQTIKEIEKIINDPENPPGLAESVEEELKVTAIEAPPQEELEHIVAPEAAAPLQRMSNFTSYTPAPGTPARRVAPPAAPPLQRMNNFMSYRPVPGEAWPEKHTKIRISNTPNVINENEMVAKENHAAISESRKGFPVSSSLFSTAKGRQAQVNRENARLNAEWNATHSRPKGPSEATRSARNKKSILKKGGKTRKQRK